MSESILICKICDEEYVLNDEYLERTGHKCPICGNKGEEPQ